MGGGAGLIPIAPGTAGSVVGVLLWWLLLADLDWRVQLGIAAAAIAVGAALIDRLVRRHGLGDEPAIVLDEIVGCWLALATAPKSLLWAAAAFALFRLGDIIKPWPVSWVDRKLAGGLGIMLDDAIVGVAVALAILAAQELV